MNDVKLEPVQLACLQKISLKDARFIECILNGKSSHQLAAISGVPFKTVRNQFARAIMRFDRTNRAERKEKAR